jgi:hypothetical protein
MKSETYENQAETLIDEIIEFIDLFEAKHDLDPLQTVDVFVATLDEMFSAISHKLDTIDIESIPHIKIPMSFPEEQEIYYSKILLAQGNQLIKDNHLEPFQLALLYQSIVHVLTHSILKSTLMQNEY